MIEIFKECLEKIKNSFYKKILENNTERILDVFTNADLENKVFISKFNFSINIDVLSLHKYLGQNFIYFYTLEKEILLFLKKLATRILFSHGYKNIEILSFTLNEDNLNIQNCMLLYCKFNFITFPVLEQNTNLQSLREFLNINEKIIFNIKDKKIKQLYVNNKTILCLKGELSFKNNKSTQYKYIHTETYMCNNVSEMFDKICPNKTIKIRQGEKTVFYLSNDKIFVEEDDNKCLAEKTNLNSLTVPNKTTNKMFCGTCGKKLYPICEEILFEYDYVLNYNNMLIPVKSNGKFENNFYVCIGYFVRAKNGQIFFFLLNSYKERHEERIDSTFSIKNIKIETFLSKRIEEIVDADITVELKCLFIIINMFNIRKTEINAIISCSDSEEKKNPLVMVIFSNDLKFTAYFIKKLLKSKVNIVFSDKICNNMVKNTLFLFDLKTLSVRDYFKTKYMCFVLKFDQILFQNCVKNVLKPSILHDNTLNDDENEIIKEIFLIFKKANKAKIPLEILFNSAEMLYKSITDITCYHYNANQVKNVLVKMFKDKFVE
ncbi:hypothetical protein EHP00_14 [Ecytonucleospora hepatopenaei]|uniref:Uncharacterized protein n=1 Tax=Ecytonucleospora hepatopenaei TaxID=646526 RepID=A0A1W0E5M0_9MICR|nr:hypothetical protein EHP00_14 [Ecytonucleospora hepatopenaei]